MNHLKYTPFPCISCGKCCRNISNVPAPLSALDRGDGICKFLNEQNNLCSIYNERPIFCRIDAYYEKYLKQEMSWVQFVQINLDVCLKLQQE